MTQTTTTIVDVDPQHEQLLFDHPCKKDKHVTYTQPNNEIYYRKLNESDLNRVKILCSQWFPINYPDQWFEDITKSSKFYSLAAVDSMTDTIIGLIVAESKQQSRCNREDRGLVSTNLGSRDPIVTYILTLGVISEKRRQGIATSLLNHLIDYLTGQSVNGDIKVTRKKRRRRKKWPDSFNMSQAVFLHVLSRNQEAINFYEANGFGHFMNLPFYYYINGECMDGISYVKYINGGRPPMTLTTITTCMSNICQNGRYFLFRHLPTISNSIFWGLLRAYKAISLRIWRPVGYLLLKVTSTETSAANVLSPTSMPITNPSSRQVMSPTHSV